MLERVAARLGAATVLVTFNGKSFDLPLLRTRFQMARMEPPRSPPHLDLLHVARRVHGKRLGSGCRLVVIERDVLGFERVDDVAGGDVAACYLHFLHTGDARGLLAVVEHNAWDVVAMAAMVGLYGEASHAQLGVEDLVGVARTLRRAGALDREPTRRRRPSGATRRRSRCAHGPTSRRQEGTGRAPSPTSRRSRPPWTTPRCGWSWRSSTSTGCAPPSAPSPGSSAAPARGRAPRRGGRRGSRARRSAPGRRSVRWIAADPSGEPTRSRRKRVSPGKQAAPIVTRGPRWAFQRGSIVAMRASSRERGAR
jgi:hypothetical protein